MITLHMLQVNNALLMRDVMMRELSSERVRRTLHVPLQSTIAVQRLLLIVAAAAPPAVGCMLVPRLLQPAPLPPPPPFPTESVASFCYRRSDGSTCMVAVTAAPAWWQ